MDRSDVFISYRRADVEFTKRLCKALQDTGRELWVDWEDILPGVEGFTDEIQRGIEGADAFICILSPSYLESEYCLMELKQALKLKKRVVPVVLKKFEPQPPPEGIGQINWVYFTPHAGQENTFAESMPKVIEALELDFQYVRDHTRWLLRAIDWDKGKRNKSYLLRDAEIEEAEHWQVTALNKAPTPTELQGEYILVSRKNQRQQQRRIMSVIGVLMALSLVAAIVAGFQWNSAYHSKLAADAARDEAVKQKTIADDQRLVAETAEKKAEAAQQEAVSQGQNALIAGLSAESQLVQSRQLGILLALEAYNASQKKGEVDPGVQTSLRSVLTNFSGIPVQTYRSDAVFVSYSPDDRWLISAADNGEVQISDLSAGLDAAPITLMKEGGLFNIMFSPDSLWLAGLTADNQISVWSLKNIQAPAATIQLPDVGQDVHIIKLAFGQPTSKQYWLAAGFSDGSIYTWSVADLPQATPTLFYQDRFKRPVTDLIFSPNGFYFSAAFDFGPKNEGPLMQIWDMNNPTADPISVDLFQASLTQLTFSPSGKWLAGYSSDSKIKIWNMSVVAQNSDANNLPLDPGTNMLSTLAFSPDDHWLVAASDSRVQVQVWNLKRLNDKPVDLPGYKDVILTAQFTPDSQWLATGDYDGHVRLWNVNDIAASALTEGQAQLFDGFDVIVYALHFNSTGTQLAAAGDQQVRVWNLPLPVAEPLKIKNVQSTFLKEWALVLPSQNNLMAVDLKGDNPQVEIQTTHKNPISYLVSTDERYLAAASSKQLQVWDLNAPQKTFFDLTLQDGQFVAPVFSTDNQKLFYAVGNQIFALDLHGSGTPVLLTGNRIVFPVDSLQTIDHWLVTQSAGEVLAWDVNTLTQPPLRLSTVSSGAVITTYKNKSTWLTIWQAGSLLIWNTAKLNAAPISLTAITTDNTLLADRWVLTSDNDTGTTRLWDLTDPASPKMSFTRIQTFPDSQNWTIGTLADGSSQALDLFGKDLQTFSLGSDPYDQALLSADDHWLAFSVQQGDQTTLELRDLTANFKQQELAGYTPLVFSPDDHWLVLQDQADQIALFNLQAGTLLPDSYPAIAADPAAIEFSSTGNWLVGILAENTNTNVLLIDLKNNLGKSYTLTGHTDYIAGWLFVADEKQLLTYSYDGTARLWDLNDLTKDPVVFRHGNGLIDDLALSQNGKFLLTNADHFTYIWRMDFEDVHNLACRLVGRNLTQAEWTKYLGSVEYRQTCSQWP